MLCTLSIYCISCYTAKYPRSYCPREQEKCYNAMYVYIFILYLFLILVIFVLPSTSLYCYFNASGSTNFNRYCGDCKKNRV